jgi:hypothetical protein
MSSYEGASYLKEVQEALQRIPSVENIKKRHKMKSMMNLNSRMDCFISKDFYMYPQGLHNSRKFKCSTIYLQLDILASIKPWN